VEKGRDGEVVMRRRRKREKEQDLRGSNKAKKSLMSEVCQKWRNF
jgi:hypothetical protein